jgi:anion-transporting  ArsA/GET3 family ATPase
LIAPYRSRFVTAASKPFYTVADRILGAQFLQDIADFFILFQTMYDGFVERARAVTRTLEDRRTAFVVVSSLDPAPIREAEFFVRALAERGYLLGAVVLNRALPAYLREPGGLVAADAMTARADEIAAELARVADDRAALAGAREVAESFRNYRLVATRRGGSWPSSLSPASS